MKIAPMFSQTQPHGRAQSPRPQDSQDPRVDDGHSAGGAPAGRARRTGRTGPRPGALLAFAAWSLAAFLQIPVPVQAAESDSAAPANLTEAIEAIQAAEATQGVESTDLPEPTDTAGDDRGRSVVVIYNTSFKGSKSVAEHYAKQRNVPDSQVIGFKLPTSESIPRSVYESKLERPLVEALIERKLIRVRDQIRPATASAPGRVLQIVSHANVRNLVVCYGVPVRTTNDISEIEPEALQLPEPLRRAEASIDAELTALPLLLAGQPRTGPLANPAYGTTNRARLQPAAGLFVVGRIDGPTPELARALVDRALEAEEFGLWGRGYFDIRSITTPAYRPGDQWISNAWVAVSRYGYDTQLDTQPATLPEGFPLSHVAFYAGWYEGNINGPFTLPAVEFMPGAIAYHLHSFSAAALRSTNRTWAGPLIAKGVTATMGCVAEPYLDGTPDIGLCFARLLFSGFTWGEATLASHRMLSWQTTVLGDPLYRPFRMNALDRLKDLAARNQGRVDWAMAVLYNRRREFTGNLDETLQAIESEPRTRFSAVLREKLGDFQREAGQHEAAAISYRTAAGLRASPQQRRRLLWNCGQAFEAARRPSDAYDAYLEFRRESPKPPNPVLLLERLQTLASALHKENEASMWREEIEKLTRVPVDTSTSSRSPATATSPRGVGDAAPSSPRPPSRR
ncbi:MAG: TIGR03790 family protein [Limisphaerales bacterium]